MSIATLERDLEQYLENTGYEVILRPIAGCRPRALVFYQGIPIAEHYHGSWMRVARAARKTIRQHQKATRILAGLMVLPE